MPAEPVTIARLERLASIVVGAGLVLNALARPTPANVVLALVGSALARRGATGHSRIYAALKIDTTLSHARTAGFTYGKGKRGVWIAADEDDPSALSFPASDPPYHAPHAAGAPATVG